MDTTAFLAIIKTDPLSLLLSFFIVVVLAIVPGNLIVRTLHTFVLHNTRSYDPAKTLQHLVGEFFGLPPRAKYLDPAGGLVGCLERSAYIFGIMFGQPGVITGVLILKAFFGWVEKISTAKVAGEGGTPSVNAYIAVYYAYIIGNLISLILGLALGELGFLLLPHLLAKVGVPCNHLCG